MKSHIEKVIVQLQKMLLRAEELYDSDNEKTATRYEAVCEHLEAAIEVLSEAVNEFE